MARRAQAKPAKPPVVTLADLDGKEEGTTDEELIGLAVKAREAGDASSDTEEDLEELFVLQTRKAYFNEAQPGGKRYKELRDRLAARLAETGPRLFTHRGHKLVGVRKQSIPVEFRDEVLLELLKDKPEILDKVMPRKVDRTAFKRACQRKDISAEEMAKICYFGKGNAAFIRYVPVKDD